MADKQAIEALFAEHRTCPPSEAFRRQANWNDPAVYERASKDYEAFLGAMRRRR